MLKRVLIILVAILVIIQFIRPEKNISTAVSANDITGHYPVPENVVSILKLSCYDCHSNNTIYPWYFNIQPIAWWMKDHIDEGKKELNFSEFASYAPKKQAHKLHAIIEEIKKDQMPLDSYLWIHKNAKLNDAQKISVTNWADSLQRSIAEKNNLPVDNNDHDE